MVDTSGHLGTCCPKQLPHCASFPDQGIGLNERELSTHPDKDTYSTVIIKKLRTNPPKPLKLAFLKEIQHMKEISHPNIISLVGVVTQEEPHMMMFEHFPNGNLKAFVQAYRDSPLVTSAVMASICT